jgi:geranylgeranylglycerol-phosphate geranylgeranyltransferase
MIISLFRLMRLYYAVPMAGGFAVIVSYLVAGDISPIRNLLILSSCSICSIIAAAYVLNDVCDINIDRINCPQRVLVQGKLHRNIATTSSVILFLAGLILAYFCGANFFFVLIFVVGVVVFYDLYSKRIGFFKDLLVAILMTSLYPLAFVLTEAVPGPRMKSLFISPFWLFLATLGYEMLKDIRDVKGDKKVGKNNIAIFSSQKWFSTSARIITVIASLITLVPFVLGYCKEIYLLSSIVGIVLAIISIRIRPSVAIRFIYAEISIVTFGAWADLLILGP